jgi:glucoamylase
MGRYHPRRRQAAPGLAVAPCAGGRGAGGGGRGGLDAAALIAIVEADGADGPFAVTDARAEATAQALEADFAALYPINAETDAPLIGRWTGDVFFGGNPWLPTTLALATLRYRRAALLGDQGAFAHGERTMTRLRAAMPAEGFPEQLDRATGAPTSCLELTWSAAAFLAAAEARAGS